MVNYDAQACELFVFEDRAVLCELSRSRAADQPIVRRASKNTVAQPNAPSSITKDFKVCIHPLHDLIL